MHPTLLCSAHSLEICGANSCEGKSDSMKQWFERDRKAVVTMRLPNACSSGQTPTRELPSPFANLILRKPYRTFMSLVSPVV
jgi:hypothetical protein